MSEHFPKPRGLGEYAKVELNLSYNYATKADLQNVKSVSRSEFAKKS